MTEKLRNRHLGLALLSFSLFALEELVPNIPCCHAGWHLASAAGMNALEQGLLTSEPTDGALSDEFSMTQSNGSESTRT